MNRLILVLVALTTLSFSFESISHANAQSRGSGEIASSTIEDVTDSYVKSGMLPPPRPLVTPIPTSDLPPPIVPPQDTKPMPTPAQPSPLPPMPIPMPGSTFPGQTPTFPTPGTTPGFPMPGTTPIPNPGFPNGTPGGFPGVTPTPYNPFPFPGITPTPYNPFPMPYPGGIQLPSSGGVDLSTLLILGQQVWNFIISTKPNADFKTLSASVVPGGITSWTQLKGWSRPVVKVYRVKFKTIFGGDAGGFDYRLTFISGGSFKGKGKYIGQIAVAPTNIQLHTDRQITFRAEILNAINYGSEEDPLAGVQLLITWASPTTTRYIMNSAEYFLYGNGEIQAISSLQQNSTFLQR